MKTDSYTTNITVVSTPNWTGPSLIFESSLNFQEDLVTRKDMIDGKEVSVRLFDLNQDGSDKTDETDETDETFDSDENEDKEDVTPEPVIELEQLEFDILREEKTV